MHISINGVLIYRFRRPPFWFVLFIQAPYALVLFGIMTVVLTMSTVTIIVLTFNSVVNNVTRSLDTHGDIFTDILPIFVPIVLMIAAMVITYSISTQRSKISLGMRRDYYVTSNDLSYGVLFMNGLVTTPYLAQKDIVSIFDDPQIKQADRLLRLLSTTDGRQLSTRWEYQLVILDRIEAAFMKLEKFDVEKMAELHKARIDISRQTHEIALGILDTDKTINEVLAGLIHRTARVIS